VKLAAVGGVPAIVVYVLPGGGLQWPLLAFCLLLGSAPFAVVTAVFTLVWLTAMPLLVHIVPWTGQSPWALLWFAVTVLAAVLASSGRLVDTDTNGACPTRAGQWLGARLRVVLAVVALACLAGLAFRRTPVVPAVCQAALCGLLYRATAPLAPPARGRGSRGRFAKALLLLVATLISVLLFEVGARWLLPHYPPPGELYEHHPEYIFLPRPGGSEVRHIPISKTERRPVLTELSSQGLRDRLYGPKEPGEYRILMLGDSFTMGHAVAPGDSIPSQVERLLDTEGLPGRVSVINAGCSGAGPLQELGVLRERGMCLEPDLVVLQVLPLNDFDNALEAVHKRLRAYNVQWHEYFRAWRRLHLPHYRLHRWLQQRLCTYRAMAGLMGGVPPAVRFLTGLRGYSYGRIEGLPPSEERHPNIEMDLLEWYPELEEGFELFKRYVRDMRDECSARGVDFVAYCVVGICELDDAVWAAIVREAGSGVAYERYKGIRKVEEFLAAEAIPSFSTLATLQAWPDIDAIYFRRDGHFAPLGNELVARRIRDYLLNDYRLRERMAEGAMDTRP